MCVGSGSDIECAEGGTRRLLRRGLLAVARVRAALFAEAAALQLTLVEGLALVHEAPARRLIVADAHLYPGSLWAV